MRQVAVRRLLACHLLQGPGRQADGPQREAHEQVRAAVKAAWSSSSRYYFGISLTLFLICLVCVSLAGWFATADLYAMRASVEFATGLPLAARISHADWFQWVSDQVVPAIVPPNPGGGLGMAGAGGACSSAGTARSGAW